MSSAPQLPLFDESDQAELGPYYEKLREKFAGLMKEKVEVQAETDTLRRRYQELSAKLKHLKPALEKNAHIYQQLFNEYKDCMKMCTLESISYDPKSTDLDQKSTTAPVVERIERFGRKKIQIEPLNMQKSEEESNEDSAKRKSTGEISNREDVQEFVAKNLIVNVEQLPNDVLLQHLNDDMIKLDVASNCKDNSSFNSSPSNINSFLETLGLSPMTTSLLPTKFVTSRRAMRSSPKRVNIERISCSRKISNPTPSTSAGCPQPNESLVDDSEQVTSIQPKNKVGRPRRQSKPMKSFKEESLRVKKRQP